MYTRTIFFTIIMAVILTGCGKASKDKVNVEDASSTAPSTTEAEASTTEITELRIENLLRNELELEDNVEVIMSMVEVPANTTLPAHFHPGEEFIYMMEGSGVLNLENDTAIVLGSGDVAKVPLKRVHSFSTKEQPAKAIVFRVHEKGQPDRTLVDTESDHEH